MSKLTIKWNEVEEKYFNHTPEDEQEVRFQTELINAEIEARKKAEMTQSELAEKSGIVQSSIAKIENMKRSPQVSTLIRLLLPLGYTLKIVPISEVNKEK